MSDSTFIIAMLVVVVCIIGVIAGVIFLAVKSAKRNAADRYVYVSATGKCYHNDPICGGSDGKEAIKNSKAIKQGYSPCSKCCK